MAKPVWIAAQTMLLAAAIAAAAVWLDMQAAARAEPQIGPTRAEMAIGSVRDLTERTDQRAARIEMRLDAVLADLARLKAALGLPANPPAPVD